MLSTTRLRASALLQRQSLAAAASRSYAHTPKDSQELNIPAHIAEAQKAVPNVSKSNEAEFKGTANDMAISEKAEVAEQLRTWQEPNRKGVWSRSQQARPVAMSGPRFEQTIMEMQVCFLSYCPTEAESGGCRG
jgi:NADH dehydrogenase (ubiquinone) Fe-S protein 6